MAEMTHVLKDDFMAKMLTNKDQELEPANDTHKSLIKYRQYNVKAVAAIMAAQANEDVITGLQDSKKTFVVTVPSKVVCKYWPGIENMFRLEDGLSEWMKTCIILSS
jgi:hypothetical protein